MGIGTKQVRIGPEMRNETQGENGREQDVSAQDVSAQDVSATRWRRTFRQQKVAETSSTPCDSEVVAETSRNVS